MRPAAAVLSLCAVLIGGALYYWNSSAPAYDPPRLLQVLPEEGAVHVVLDLDLLRKYGLLDSLAGSPTLEEPDYRKFVEESGFDYRQHLKSAALAFSNGQTLIAASGTFDFERLAKYAQAHGGQCEKSLCSLPGSQPDRQISFYPLPPNAIAIAVAPVPKAVANLTPHAWRTPPQPGATPLWVSLPSSALSDLKSLPAGTRAFLSPLAQTQGATLKLAPAKDAFELQLAVAAASNDQAASLATQYTATTDLLKKMLTRDNLKPSPSELTGVLTSGHFQSTGSNFTGVWTLPKAFFDQLVSGKLN